jgi:hypothetical protein
MTGNSKNALLIASAWVLSANIGAAGAATYIFYADAQGSINESDVGNGTSSGNFYLAGNCGSGCGQGEVRDFFQFDVTGLSGQVVSAELAIDVGNLELDQLDYLTYEVTSLPAVPLTSLTFAELGTGLVYGSRTYAQSDDRLKGVTISLDAAALSAIAAGGFFGVSGRVTSPTIFGPTAFNQYIFGEAVFPQQLIVTTDVPETSTWALMAFGVAGLGLAAYRQQRKHRAAGAMI